MKSLSTIFLSISMAISVMGQPIIQPDAPFATNGKGLITVNPATGYDTSNDLAVQPDGKIIMVGNSRGGNDDWGVIRLKQDGSLDSTFGTNGIYRKSLQTSVNEYATSVELQPDGKIVVAGVTRPTQTGLAVFGLVRLNADGTEDASFGTNGVVVSNFSLGDDCYATDLAILADGKILVGGYYEASKFNFILARYNSNGTLDNTFGVNGRQIIDAGASDIARSMTIQTDGKILMSGQYVIGSQWVVVVRLDQNGAKDSTFGTNGVALHDIPGGSIDAGYSVRQRKSGKLVVSGWNGGFDDTDNSFVLGLKEDGSLDSSFATDGLYKKDFGDGFRDQFLSSIVLENGNIVSVGFKSHSANTSTRDFLVSILTEDGVPVDNFGSDGAGFFDFRSTADAALSVRETPDNKIVIGGYSAKTSASSSYDFAILQLVEFDSSAVSVADDLARNPDKMLVAQNYPNPFNPSTVIEYNVPELSEVTVKVFDLLGREIATLVNGNRQVGLQTITFNASGLPSGLYMYQVKAGNQVITKKMLLSK